MTNCKNTEGIWVLKVGSSTITNNGTGLNTPLVREWVNQISYLKSKGISFVIVTSGAIVEGIRALRWESKPEDFSSLQAAASIGQVKLMQFYERLFEERNIGIAQILLTHSDFSNKGRYSNIQTTVKKLINLNIVPIINENDSISTEEIGFEDNDMLAALLSNAIDAKKLIIFTDQIGLMTKNPRQFKDAVLIKTAKVNSPITHSVTDGNGKFGKGGMKGKISAARMFSLSGGITTIVHGHANNVIIGIYKNDYIGTELQPVHSPIEKHKCWLASHKRSKGAIVISDPHITKSIALNEIENITGNFEKMDMISIINNNGREIAHGLANYSASEVAMLRLYTIKKQFEKATIINFENTITRE